MERRKFIANGALAAIGLSLIPGLVQAASADGTQVRGLEFPESELQIRHGLYNLETAQAAGDWLSVFPPERFAANGISAAGTDLKHLAVRINVSRGRDEVITVGSDHQHYYLIDAETSHSWSREATITHEQQRDEYSVTLIRKELLQLELKPDSEMVVLILDGQFWANEHALSSLRGLHVTTQNEGANWRIDARSATALVVQRFPRLLL